MADLIRARLTGTFREISGTIEAQYVDLDNEAAGNLAAQCLLSDDTPANWMQVAAFFGGVFEATGTLTEFEIATATDVVTLLTRHAQGGSAGICINAEVPLPVLVWGTSTEGLHGYAAPVNAGGGGVSHLGFFEADISTDVTGTLAEDKEVWAWFFSTEGHESAAVAFKRCDVVVNPLREDYDRGARIVFPYDDSSAAYDAWSGSYGGTDQTQSMEPHVDDTIHNFAGLSLKDCGDTIAEWHGSNTPDMSPVGSTRKRKWAWSLDVEHLGGWAWAWKDSSDNERVVIKQQDLDTCITDGLPAVDYVTGAGFLYLRVIEVCDPDNPETPKHMAILASKEW